MKPIEEGCLAVVTGGSLGRVVNGNPNTGKVVTVGKFIGKPSFCTLDIDCWEVSPPLQWKSGMRGLFSEKYLLRIDGYEETEKSEQEAEA